MEKIAYRVDEAVMASGIGRSKLYELIQCGEIEVVHVGRRTLIPFESLASYLKGLQRNDAR